MGAGTIAVYAGKGSSHSWTWLADLFEAKGILDVRFLDSPEFVLNIGSGTSHAIISGGDGFSIAESLKGEGFRRLRAFVDSGGTYVGVCAGAYLPLPSSLEPFSEFNISKTKIANIDMSSHEPPNVPPRVSVRYGDCSIVHPIRGEVELDADGRKLLAPLYGGPAFLEPQEDKVLLWYRGFTVESELQMRKALAEQMIPGKPAAVSCTYGKGRLLLFGPHLEHPRYPEANLLFLEMLGLAPHEARSPTEFKETPSLDRAIADLKVAIVGLENRSFLVGRKVWDGSRYLELVRAIEARTWTMEDELAEVLATSLWRVRESVAGMRVGIESDADETTGLLVESARACVDQHFQALVRGR